MRDLARQQAVTVGETKWFDISERIQKVMEVEKGLYPNVDFYAASLLHDLGLETDLFTPMFAAARAAGWTAHIREQYADNRLIRPDSEYIGPRDQVWVPVEERSVEEGSVKEAGTDAERAEGEGAR